MEETDHGWGRNRGFPIEDCISYLLGSKIFEEGGRKGKRLQGQGVRRMKPHYSEFEKVTLEEGALFPLAFVHIVCLESDITARTMEDQRFLTTKSDSASKAQ
ncbi:Solute Carrier Family 45 Member 4 [Manis pentadactyla]|nr:Solute Carrier Family 45 Member 4 [Manis pentadactyla]